MKKVVGKKGAVKGRKTGTISLSAIKPNPDNPRQIRGEQFDRLKRSIKEFPQMMALRPIVVDAKGVTLGGNMRLEALKALGYTDIPEEWVKRADKLTPEQRREFVIKDNGQFGEYDWDLLANGWSDLPLADWGVDLPADWLEQKGGAEEDESAVGEMVDRAAELQQKWQVSTGQIYRIGRHRLMCGDSTSAEDVGRLMGGARAVLLATDPPYNVSIDYGDAVDDDKAAAEYEAFSRGWFGAWQAVSERQIVTPAFANIAAWCAFFGQPTHIGAWTKTNSMTRGSVSRFACYEPVFFYGERWRRERANDVFDYPVSAQKIATGETLTELHPCPKPLPMWVDLFESYTETGDVVADAFAGSGTALQAAEQAGRVCYAMDLTEKFVAVCLERMSALGLSPELVK